MPHPIDSVVVDAVNVGKSSFRDYFKRRVRLVTSVTEVQAGDFTEAFGGLDIDGAHYNLDAADTTTADDGVNCIVDSAGNRFKLGFISAPTFLFPAGAADAPGIAIGAITSGICQLSPNTLQFVNEWQGTTSILQNHGNVSVADNHSLVIGSPDGELMRGNHGAIEINRLGKKSDSIGASVPLQLNEWESTTGSAEPVVFYKSRGATKGAVGAVQANDVLGLIQGQGDDGAGAANPISVNIGMRVKPGSTVAPGSVPGEFYVMTAPDGGGVAAVRIKVSDDGLNILTGDLTFDSTQDVVIDENRNGFFVSLLSEGAIKSESPTEGIGYATGAGGDVNQGSGSGKATAVTLNKVVGRVIMDGAALAAAAEVQFTLNNSTIGANDGVLVVHRSGGTAGAYLVQAIAAAGSAKISVRNVSAGSLSQAIQLMFFVFKGVIA